VLHGQHIRNVDREFIGEEDTLLWLLRGDLKGETASEITAAHDQALQTKYLTTKKYYKRKQRANVECKLFDVTVKHIISACTVLGKEQYIQRHGTVCAELHCNISKVIGGKCTTNIRVALYRN